MNLTQPDSSTIGAYAYSAKASKLFIEFKSGKSYIYHDVPAKVFNEFTNASSLGSFHAKNIKQAYRVDIIASFDDFCSLTGESVQTLKKFSWVEDVIGEACCL